MNPFVHPYGVASGHFASSLPPALAAVFVPLLILVLVWSVIWKGIALWYAARNHQRVWFIVFLIVNTLGILEILYIIFWRKNKNSVVTTTTTTHVTTASTPAPASQAPTTDTTTVE